MFKLTSPMKNEGLFMSELNVSLLLIAVLAFLSIIFIIVIHSCGNSIVKFGKTIIQFLKDYKKVKLLD